MEPNGFGEQKRCLTATSGVWRGTVRHGWVVWLLLMILGGAARADVGDWVKVVASAPWGPSPRPSVVAFQNKLWMFIDQVKTDSSMGTKVWRSSDGIQWDLVSADLPLWLNMGKVIVFKDKLWATSVGGDLGHLENWSSADGVNWTREATDLPWSGTGIHPTAVLNDRIYVYGMYTSTYRALWSSADGVHWDMSMHELNGLRYTSSAFISFAGKLWVLGGFNGSAPTNEVWSSPDGANWTKAGLADWSPRIGDVDGELNAVVYDGKLWIMGGRNDEAAPLSDVWFTPDGVRWFKTADNSTQVERESPALAEFAGKLWLFGGFTPSPDYHIQNDIWATGLEPGAAKIKPIGLQTAIEGTTFTLHPQLSQGSRPMTWSLVSAPAGMTIDPEYGKITWPTPKSADSPYTITVHANNQYAPAAEALFGLTVTTGGAPEVYAPRWAAGTEVDVTWSAAPNVIGYTLQADESPDFATPLASLDVPTTATRAHHFTDLQDGQTYWYRVRANRPAGMVSVWSASTSSTQDAWAPYGTVMINVRVSPTTSSQVTLTLTAQDPGNHPSGLSLMRFSDDGSEWSEWVPYAPTHAWRLHQRTGQVLAQFQDRAGNISNSPASGRITLTPRTIYVDGAADCGKADGTAEHPFAKIQQAIDAANPACEIVVRPGVYKENLVIRDGFTLRSINPYSPAIVHTTIIDGQSTGSVITYPEMGTNGELAGFTITHGKALLGGGISIGSGSPVWIHHNQILGNQATHEYTQQVCYDGFHVRWEFFGSGLGGAIYGGTGAIENNVIAGNCAMPVGSGFYNNFNYLGGALYGCNGLIRHNTFWSNQVGSSAYIHPSVLSNCFGRIVNNIFARPAPTDQIWQYLDSCSNPEHCLFPAFWQNLAPGNLAADPKLLDPENGDFHLQPDSPCINAGAATGLAIDFEGQVRDTQPDIGADEYLAQAPGAVVHVDQTNVDQPWLGTVKDPYQTIQAAIDAATAGSTIIVAPGVYQERVAFHGKDLVLRSMTPTSPRIVQATVIDAGYSNGPAVSFKGTETSACVLSGFTITHGIWPTGGGINGANCMATIEHNLVINNVATGGYQLIGDPFTSSVIASEWGLGGGLCRCDGLIRNNIIAYNQAVLQFTRPGAAAHTQVELETVIHDYQYYGGGLYDCDGTIVGNTIWGNEVHGGFNNRAYSALAACDGTIRNCIIWESGTTPDDAAANVVATLSNVAYCVVQNAANDPQKGILNAYPNLVDPANGDFHLRPDSPCIDAGTSVALALDFEGETRPVKVASAARGDGSGFDIGADEFVNAHPLTVSVLSLVDALRAGGDLLVYWVSDVTISGTGVRFELLAADGTGQPVDLGAAWSPEGYRQTNLLLPANLTAGDYRVRVRSTWNNHLWADSEVFTVQAGQAAVAPEAWSAYE